MRKIIAVIAGLLLISACSTIDCPLNNTVYTVYKIYNSAGTIDTLKDTLTIYSRRVNGTDSVFINKDIKVTSFNLPISYSAPADTLFFEFKDTVSTYHDTVIITKDNTPHFESVDCSPSFFHKITGVKWTGNRIDSIIIKNANVDYDATKEHFHIYFKSNN